MADESEVLDEIHELQTSMADHMTAARWLQAEQLARRVLALAEQIQHPALANFLTQLAMLCDLQGKTLEDRSLKERALAIREQQWDTDDQRLVHYLQNLGFSYKFEGQWAQAEPFFQRALTISENAGDLVQTANQLVQLGSIAIEMQRYADAESLLRRASAIYDDQGRRDDSPLIHLARLLRKTGREPEADAIEQQRREITQQQQADLLQTGDATDKFAVLMQQGHAALLSDPEQGVALFKQACAQAEAHLGVDEQTRALADLATACKVADRKDEAEKYYRSAISQLEKALGPSHLSVADKLILLARLFEEPDRQDEREQLYRRALSIREEHFGTNALELGNSLTLLGYHFASAKKYAQAVEFFQRVVDIQTQQLGPDDPRLVKSQSRLSDALRWQSAHSNVLNADEPTV